MRLDSVFVRWVRALRERVGAAVMRAAFALVLAIGVASCGGGQDIRPGIAIQVDELSVPDTTALVNSSDIRIGPLDLLAIKVFGVEDLSGDFQVDHLGKLKYPLIGEVDAKGYTPSEFAEILERALAARYMNDPEVSVLITESAGDQVTVEGYVAKPGLYPVRGRVTLLQVISIAGGEARDSNSRRVLIFRTIDGRRHVAAFDLQQIRRGRAEDPTVFGNDIVVVDGSGVRSSYRELLQTVPLLALFVAL